MARFSIPRFFRLTLLIRSLRQISSEVPLIIGCNRQESDVFFSCAMTMLFDSQRRDSRNESRHLAPDADVPRIIETYKAVYPGSSPSDIFFLAATDRGVRRNSIDLAERKVAQRSASVYMYLFAWKSPALDGKLRSPHTAEIPFVFDNTEIYRNT